MTLSVTVNHRQAHAWNGPLGRHWAAQDRRFDAMLGEADEALFAAAAIGPGDRVLDIGCGAGATTRTAARLAAPGHAVGVDISAPLVDRARERTAAERVPGATFELGDVQAYPFRPGGFDVAISRGGVMFFEDHVTAFANVARALRERGRLVFVCPRRPGPDAEEGAALGLFARRLAKGTRSGGGDPDPGDRAAHTAMASLSEPYRIHAALHRSFAHIAVNPVDVHTHWGDSPADAVDFLLSRAPERSVPAATRAALESTLRPYATSRGVRTRAGVWLVTAVRRDDAGV
ncbi:methyltransferase domain-containing protein [Streptomyces sp. SID8379]|uniref:class I SAM-dependent methyltransferase n=1 Tax=unclassified Streptomyces TaxID=2593676 RepID=UPI000381EF2C|nr:MULTISPECIES: class I SAM-dependent methyltransferase [unclassified Streptomyces]MYW66782.1 methyltransferase domain-containing protein [Streptomyces sp. SID8379]